jgi:hypothetical protein
MNFSNPETQQSKASTDGLTRYIIKLAAKTGRRRVQTGWLYITQITEMENYQVKGYQYGPNRDRAQRMGKLQAERVVESLKKWRRRPVEIVAEPEVQE